MGGMFLPPPSCLTTLAQRIKTKHSGPSISRRRNWQIRSMRAVVQRVASASVEVMQKNYGVLLVSQFTLYGMLKGNKPDFHVTMPPLSAKPFYASLVDKFRSSYNPDSVKDGVFGAMMKVNLVNDGPVTMQLDSPQTSKSTSETTEG
ncbi:D-aminoacyl-tRNA deacylase 1-like isoform X1 [Papaver somniferum]|uniref:D-aminoacyl-tRNA deacylase 1-like isoform X1 n=1 Tax=Papaver somniferum TaxID=3469 RepID=UPI000E6F4F8A|nr:D-aminoacyl-tRNA deacylase 1-like isoform X1 [Papaver somniferum]